MFAGLLLLLLADGVDLLNVSDLLILLVDDFPLLLECGDELLALVFGHEELLLVALVLLLQLHFSHHLVLVLDFSLDLLDVLRNLTEVLLLEVVLIGVGWKLGSGEDVLNGISNDVVFVTYQTQNGLLVLLGDGGTLLIVIVLELGQGRRRWQNRVTGTFLLEHSSFRLDGASGATKGERDTALGVRTTLGLIVTGNICDVGLRGGLQGESARSRGDIMWVGRLVPLRLRRLVTLLRD
jgi:hypothetical protein